MSGHAGTDFPVPTDRIKTGIACLLLGRETSAFDNGTHPYWKAMAERLQAIPVGDRPAIFKAEIELHPGINSDRFLADVAAINPDSSESQKGEVTGPSVAGLPEAFPFPTDALPPVLRDYILDCSLARGCPPEFIGVPALALAGSAIGTSTLIEAKPGWREQPSIYAVVVAPSSTQKSPAMGDAMEFTTSQAWHHEVEHKQALSRFDQEQAEYDSAVARRNAARKSGENLHLPDKPKRPVMGRSWVDDVTVEALAQRLSENERGLALIREEFSGFMMSMNVYKGGRGPDQAFFLSAWSGMQIQVDRKSSPDPIILRRPFLTIVGGVQPGILQRVLSGDKMENGFAARFLFAYPAPSILKITDYCKTDVHRERVADLFDSLYRIPLQRDAHLRVEPRILRLTPEAFAIFQEYRKYIYAEINQLAEDDPLRPPLGKLTGQLLRIVLVDHLIRCVPLKLATPPPVSAESMTAGIRLIEYFHMHAMRAWRVLTEAAEERTGRKLLDWLKRRGPAGATRRDILRHGAGGVRNQSEADRSLGWLSELGSIELFTSGRTERVRYVEEPGA